MQLRRGYVTKASEIMLPLYPTLVIPIGLFLIFQDPSRTTSDTFAIARILLPMPGWGCLFVAVGLAEVSAMVMSYLSTASWCRRLYECALVAGAGLCAFWMVLILSAAFQSKQVSFTAGWWLILIVGAHIASARSLGSGEHS